MNESGFAAFKERYTFDQALIADLFHYGSYEADFANENEYGAYRVSVIRHDKTNKLYWIYQYNGSVIDFKELD